MDKTYASAAEAVADIPDGASLAVGGFGLSGVPIVLIRALLARGTSDLEVVSNNCGVDGWGLGELLLARAASARSSRRTSARTRSSRASTSAARSRSSSRRRARSPSGCARAASASPRSTRRPAPARRSPRAACRCATRPTASVALASDPKELRPFDAFGRAREYVLEQAIRTDFGLVRAAVGDRHGNLRFEKSTRNFNPLAGMAGRVTIAEVDELVEPGVLDPDDIHLPGIYVDRVVVLTPGAVGRPADREGDRAAAAAASAPQLPTERTPDAAHARRDGGPRRPRTRGRHATSTSASGCRR